eukprot:TRINITY_DN23002_c0_g1_i1.p1 TRINITY_DN23002_c0_g1~~TRINITY_DN23002_c0_g1_i1.p1  ORF type:complete len:204 (-),score=33.57 TRINITY_DN23002_c0_g1_i1:624-1235(-)
MASSASPPAPLSGGGPAAARVFFSKAVESVKASMSQKKPWSEMVDRSSFSRPESLAEASSRLRKNLGYFRVNYAIILAGFIALFMLWNPAALGWLIALGVLWGYLFMIRVEPLVISGRTISEREKFLGMCAISLMVVFGLTSIGSVLMSGILIGAALICAHASVRVPDDLFLDDQEASGGFLSFLGTGAPKGPGVQLSSLGHV